MNISRWFTLVVAAMVLALAVQNTCAQAEKEPAMAPNGNEGTMGPVKNRVESRLNKMSQELALTMGQQAAIKPILEDEENKLKALRADAGQDVAGHRSKVRELRAATLNKIRPVLTPEQQQRLDAQRKDAKERRQKRDIDQSRRKE